MKITTYPLFKLSAMSVLLFGALTAQAANFIRIPVPVMTQPTPGTATHPAIPAVVVPVGPGVLQVDSSLVSFGTVIEGATSGLRTVSVQNSGESAISLTVTAPAAPFSISSPDTTCGAVLAPNASCVVGLVFQPTSGSATTASLVVGSDVGNASVPLSGNPVTQAALFVDQAPVAFGAVLEGEVSTLHTVTVSNSGGSPLTFSYGPLSAPFSISAPDTNCGTSLAPGGSCTIGMLFQPTSAGQATTATLAVNSSFGNAGVPLSASITAAVRTVGVNLGAVVGSRASIGTTENGATLSRDFVFTNTGNASVTLGAASFSGAHPQYYSVTTNSCVGLLPVGQPCTVTVQFAPTGAVTGSTTADLRLAHNGVGGGTTAYVSGLVESVAQGIAPVASTEVGLLAANDTFNGVFTLQNKNTVLPVTITNVTGEVTSYIDVTITSNNCATLAPNATCQIGYRYVHQSLVMENSAATSLPFNLNYSANSPLGTSASVTQPLTLARPARDVWNSTNGTYTSVPQGVSYTVNRTVNSTFVITAFGIATGMTNLYYLNPVNQTLVPLTFGGSTFNTRTISVPANTLTNSTPVALWARINGQNYQVGSTLTGN